jgi:formylglycine-generating enzyme required for sulfatase activity
MQFCRCLRERSTGAYTLPSQAQWEYACRAGTATSCAFGKTLTPEQANDIGDHTYRSGSKGAYRQATTGVARFSAHAWGMHDMHGNMWEWCLNQWRVPPD